MTRRETVSARFQLPLRVEFVPKWESKTSTATAKLVSGFSYLSDKHGEIYVPKGFETDFASVPSAARWYVDVVDPDILYAAIVHDLIYQHKGEIGNDRHLTRSEADAVLLDAMRACGAPAFKSRVVHAAVRVGGWAAWKD